MTPAQIIAKLLGPGWSFVRGFSGSTAVNSDGHHGWDFAAKLGTPIPSFTGGIVVYAENAGGGCNGLYVGPCTAADNEEKAKRFWANGGGNVVIVQAADGTRYQYAHLSKIAVHVGDTVSPGSLLGQVGATGDATGAHVHFAMIRTAITGTRDKRPIYSNVEWIDPSSFLTTLAASGISFNLLGAWNNIVAFPTGHILTEADVNDIIAKLDAAHFFQATGGIPGLQQLAENAARDTTRAILMAHVGEAWNASLEQALQDALFGAAKAAVTNPIQGLADVAGRLLDPMTYVHTGAFLIGAVLLFVGVRWIAQGNSETVG